MFYIDPQTQSNVSYLNLIDDINGRTTYNKYCYTKYYYQIFQSIIYSLIIDEEIILLDNDFTKKELIELTGEENFDVYERSFKIGNQIKTKEELIKRILEPKKKWRLTLYTSGTTGIPKKVSHTLESITRFIKQDFYHNDDVWGFAYNPTHMAGVQVFFQALLNGNTIVRLFQLNNINIYSVIDKYKISHISASPSFYNLLYNKSQRNNFVKRISVGGERFNEIIREKLITLFPNAKITNIYASTELGTLLAAADEYFTIKPEYANVIKIIDNELYVNKIFLGEGTFEREEYYATGDIVDIISENPLKFKFIGRKNEMINIGGYKVNPIEVEEAIKSIEGISEAIVYSKKNSVLGNIICCDVMLGNPQIKEETIRKMLTDKLQEFKIPRIINFVDQIGLTRTGKIKRT